MRARRGGEGRVRTERVLLQLLCVKRRYADEKNGGVGIVGYEINFNRHFYQYQPPRPLAEIEADLRSIEAEIAELLAEVLR